tara:strand:- start:5155 stop:5826 length:672 start_codon:yes stop_codon:yes gene_type:complete
MIKFLRNIRQRIKRNIFAKNQKRKINQTGSLINAFNDSNTIFVHIPKTAGTSIIKAIYGDVSKEGHRSIYFYKQVFDKDFKDFFTFTFIRNPFDRLYSSYKFLQNGGMNEHDKNAFHKYLSHYTDFEDFVLNGLNSEIIYEIIHFIPQSEFICNNDGKIMVDFIGRFENLYEDLNDLSEKINKEIVLEHHNKNNKLDFSKIYTEDMKLKVYNIYKKDVEIFSY